MTAAILLTVTAAIVVRACVGLFRVFDDANEEARAYRNAGRARVREESSA